MLNSIASLRTPTTHVDVSETSWSEPTQTHVTQHRPAITLVLLGSTFGVEAGYYGRPDPLLSRIGHVVFTPPDTQILGRSCAAGKVRLVQCSYDRTYAERVVGSLSNLSQSQLLSCLSVRSALLPTLLSRLMTEAIHPSSVSAPLAESLGQAILLECSQAVLSTDSKEARERLTARHFNIIDEYLTELKYAAPSVAAIAQACGFSERYFAKLFREQTQQSIGQYLKSVQIAKAQAYLLETDLPLKEIAFRLGFSATSNFSVAFRAATNETPARFRAANRLSKPTQAQTTHSIADTSPGPAIDR